MNARACLIVGFVCFVLAVASSLFGVVGVVPWVPLGLAFWAGSQLL